MQKVVTHSGSFDPDDVLAVALVQLYVGPENVEIVRSREKSVLESGDWVLDVGGVYDVTTNRFDHHQNGVPARDNGVPYSAFGLVWREYGEAVCGSAAVAEQIERQLVQPIDAADNHVTVCHAGQADLTPFEFFDVIDAFKPVWGSDEQYDSQFTVAVELARTLLTRLIAHRKADVALHDHIRSKYNAAEQKAVLQFERPVPRHALVPYEDVQVVVSPTPATDVDRWTAAVVPMQQRGFQNRVTFPASWAGLEHDELAAISGIADAVFCHKERYIFVAESKEAALRAAHHVRM